MMQPISERLKEIRAALGINQKEFGEGIGVGVGVIKNWEQQKTEPKILQIEQICKAYKINKDWLLTGEGEMSTYLTPNEAELADLVGLAINPFTPTWKQEAIRVILKKVLTMTEEERYRIVAFMEEYLSATEGIVEFRKNPKDGE